MDNTVYSTLANQVGILNNLQLSTNNMANTQTHGFKGDTMLFKQYHTPDVLDKTTMPNDVSTVANFEEGPFKATNRPLDVAISGPGFFIIQTQAGVKYTRNGSFTVNAEGTLITQKGEAVLGFDESEIVFEPSDLDPTILADGRVLVGGVERGTIGIADFVDPRFLRKGGDNLFTSSVPPMEPESSQVLQGVLEESNVVSITEMARVLELNTQMQAASQMIQNNYDLSKGVYRAMSKQGG